MRALTVELRTSRMRYWSVLATLAGVAITLIVVGRWSDSWAGASIWGVAHLIYTAALVVAGAADTERLRRSTSLQALEQLSGRPAWQRWAVRLVPTVLFGVVLPVGIPAAMAIAVSAFGARHGVLTLEYVGVAALFALAALLMGIVIGIAITSRITVIIVALVLGIGLGLVANPVPPSNYAWMQIHPVNIVVTAVLALIMVGAVVIAAPIGSGPSGRVRSIIAMVLMAAPLVFLYQAGAPPTQRERTGGEAAVCDSAGSYPVCVWPGDEFYHADIAELSDRFHTLNEHLGGPGQWVLAQPGLQVDEPVVRVSPMGRGEGMWFVAEQMAFALSNELQPEESCDYDQYTEEDWEEATRVSWPAVEAATNFIYGDWRPASVRLADAAFDQEIRDAAEPVAELPEREQLEWIEQQWQEMLRCRN